MCELFAISAAQPSVLRYELDLFAREGGERHRNRDGWGIAFAEDRDSHLFREAEPAASSALAHMVLAREIPSKAVIAHVRRASRGTPAIANTHPFTRTRQGHVLHFAHNGTLPDIEQAPGAQAVLGERVGDTDSELAFLLLLDRLEQAAADTPERRFAVFTAFCADMRMFGSANFLFYDGTTLFAHADRRRFETETGLTQPREPGLVIRRFETAEHCAEGWRANGAHIPDIKPGTILLASVPLNEQGWEPLARGATLALRDGVVLASAGA